MIPITVYELDKDTDVEEDIVSQTYQNYSDCVTCVEGFLTPTDLLNHLVTHQHIDDIALCQGYAIRTDIVSQIYQNSSDCARCVKGFLTPTDLENHIVSHRYMDDMDLCQHN